MLKALHVHLSSNFIQWQACKNILLDEVMISITSCRQAQHLGCRENGWASHVVKPNSTLLLDWNRNHSSLNSCFLRQPESSWRRLRPGHKTRQLIVWSCNRHTMRQRALGMGYNHQLNTLRWVLRFLSHFLNHPKLLLHIFPLRRIVSDANAICWIHRCKTSRKRNV